MMKKCTITIKAPEKILKGAGITNTSFIPAYIYKLNIELKNTSDIERLCSFSSTLGNGIRYLNNMEHSGPDLDILQNVNIVKPDYKIRNNNVIVFANNITLSPNSTNILTFDIALYENMTINSSEHTGEKILH